MKTLRTSSMTRRNGLVVLGMLAAAVVCGLLIGLVSVTPALAMIPRMDERGKVLCGASVVCGASAFSAHLGFALSAEPEMAAPLLLAKLLGCAVGVILALATTRREMREAKKGV